ncbi:unnamed protein product [Vitrella brassicaformis CCMP3155]|uniref:Ribosome biogenesis protein NOP53 n=2 Tax=Vitrella brassicaformis TaxID=1169539 RepID=A0A0G4EWF2_VITBC|nr:unnamed protein product [Vitrella brassicaformis CCMP3155]|eukprot:CEM03287.1 unnamed protein product [Vitrella brassicaformis CCMP3155]
MVKQKRSSWKRIETDDVEAGQKEDQVRRHLSGKAGDALFVEDTHGSTAGLSRSVRKRMRLLKEKPAARKLPDHVLRRMERERLRMERRERQNRNKQLSAEDGPVDLWGSSTLTAPAPSRPSVHPNERIKDRVRRRHEPFRPTVVAPVPAVPLPHPGQSYNPHEPHRQSAVFTAAALVMAQDDRREMVERSLKPLTASLMDVLPEETVNQMDDNDKIRAYQLLQEGQDASAVSAWFEGQLMRKRVKKEGGDGQDNDDDDDDDAADEDQDEDETPGADALKTAKQTKLGEKKTRTQRNREARRKAQDQQLQAKLELKKRRRDFEQIKSHLESLKALQEQRAARRQYRELLKHEAEEAQKRGEAAAAKRLGRHVYREAPPDVVLSEDVRGSLRSAKVSGSAIADRAQSIYRRGLLEAPPKGRQHYSRKVRKTLKHKENPLIRRYQPALF